jgi:hypothetical protein
MRTVIGIATAGRRDLLKHSFDALNRLRPAPAAILVAPATPTDLDTADLERIRAPVIVVQPARKGLTSQRNAILDAIAGQAADVVVFFDDDYLPCADYLLRLQEAFDAHPDTVGFTGRPAVDGATGPGVDLADGLAVRDGLERNALPQRAIGETYGTYGCNMAFRLGPIQAHGIRFDEVLPLYGWLEDIDFSRRVAPFGRIRESNHLRGVHLGTKSGRVSGIRFGYSQVANPFYCWRKGSMSFRYASRQMARNIAANLVRCFKPEPWVDRKGRLVGNLYAIADVIRGRASPSRIVDL